MKSLLTVMILLFSLVSHGQCVEGNCENGSGTKKYSNGNKYQGSFKNGKRHGQGKFKWASGAIYDGSWVDGKREGQGQEILADGTIYVGSFSDDVKHGSGTLYSKDKKVLQKGEWLNGTAKNTGSTKPKTVINPVPESKPLKSTSPKILNIGLGLGSFYGLDSYGFSDASSSSIPPISISVDFPSKKTPGLTFGGYFGYSSSKLTVRNEFFGDYGWRSSYYILGGRATYSYNLFNSEKTIPYGSFMLGYNVAKSSYFGDDSFGNSYSAASGGFTYSGAIGLRHMFNAKTGAFAELGYGIAYLTVGIAMKL